jgi:protein SCO1
MVIRDLGDTIMSARAYGLVIFLMLSLVAAGSQRPPNEAKFLGREIADIYVTDTRGEQHLLSALIGSEPVLLSPVYTSCPSACSVITAHLKEAVAKAGGLGKNFTVITFSFDHEDSPEDLQVFTDRWKLEEPSWKVVAADREGTNMLLASIDFEITKDDRGEFEHPNVVLVVSPGMKISRFIHGVVPKSRDIKIGILEAKKEQSSLSFYEGFLARCFKFDSESNTYVVDWPFVIQVTVGLLFISTLVILVIRDMFFRDIEAA